MIALKYKIWQYLLCLLAKLITKTAQFMSFIFYNFQFILIDLTKYLINQFINPSPKGKGRT